VIIIIYTSSYKSPVDIEVGCAIGAIEDIIKPKEPSLFTQLIEKAILEHKNRAIIYPLPLNLNLPLEPADRPGKNFAQEAQLPHVLNLMIHQSLYIRQSGLGE
jgi:hypothetical protein